MIGLIARYHRKALPKRSHKYYKQLSDNDQNRVAVLSGILRIADGLDRSHYSVVSDLTAEIRADEIKILCKTKGPATFEMFAASKKADLLELIFHRDIIILSDYSGIAD